MQFVNAETYFTQMRKSLGNKRNYITPAQITDIVNLYTGFEKNDKVKIFDNADLGYTKVRVEQPQTDENGKPVTKRNGDLKPDTDLRDYERIPLKKVIDDYFAQEVLPHVPDAWLDENYKRVGYEINFTKYFYQYEPLRSLEEITEDLLALEEESEGLFQEIVDTFIAF